MFRTIHPVTCGVPWFLARSELCSQHTQSTVEHSHCPNRNPVPLSCRPPSSQPPPPPALSTLLSTLSLLGLISLPNLLSLCSYFLTRPKRHLPGEGPSWASPPPSPAWGLGQLSPFYSLKELGSPPPQGSQAPINTCVSYSVGSVRGGPVLFTFETLTQSSGH